MLLPRVVPAFLTLAASLLAPAAASAHGAGHGAVFTLTNATSGNAVAVFDRHQDGTLSPAGVQPTGGTGTGGGLGSQGAIALSRDGRRLFAVNAGSNTIAELAVRGHHVRLVATIPSGGTTPISVAVRGRLVYVLHAGGSGNIAGFRIGRHDDLTPLAGSVQPLGAGSAGPAQVAFTPDGSALVVTEKASSTIDTYPVDHSGVAGAPTVSSSAGATPFGFDFDRRGHLLVSEAGGTASSYDVSAGGVSVITGALATGQAAPCWLVRAGRFAYTANGGSGTISGFRVGRSGSLALLDASGVAADLGAGSHPLDETVTRHGGRFLYNLTDGLHRITGFRVGHDGSLRQVSVTTGLPVGAAGIVAS